MQATDASLTDVPYLTLQGCPLLADCSPAMMRRGPGWRLISKVHAGHLVKVRLHSNQFTSCDNVAPCKLLAQHRS